MIIHWWTGYTIPLVLRKTFLLFKPHSLINQGTNNTSFESPSIKPLELGKKLGVALP